MCDLPLLYACIYINRYKCEENLKHTKEAKTAEEGLLRKEFKIKPPDMKLKGAWAEATSSMGNSVGGNKKVEDFDKQHPPKCHKDI